MKITFNAQTVTVTREASDQRIYNDSRLWYAIRNELKRMGHDVIKKLMYKDGHLTDDVSHYIRSRNMEKQGAFMLVFNDKAIRPMYKDYNEGELVLTRFDTQTTAT